MTLRIGGLYVTLSITMLGYSAECHFAECPIFIYYYVECHYAECCYAECRYAGRLSTVKKLRKRHS